jgi:hypothetical protein
VYHPEVDLPALKAVADDMGGLGLSLGSPLLAKRRPFDDADDGDAEGGEQGHAAAGVGKRRQSSSTESSGGAERGFQPQPVAPPEVQPDTPLSMDVGQATAAGLTGWPGFPVPSGVLETREEEGGPSKRIRTLWSMPDQNSAEQHGHGSTSWWNERHDSGSGR